MLFALLPQIPLQVGAIKADLAIIHDPNAVSGKDFSTTYAEKLDKIFKGTAPLFSNTTKEFPIGTSLNINKTYTVANAISGMQCYIYAQAVYYYLFGDIPFKGDGYMYWSDSKKIVSNELAFSYDLFVRSGVGFGAYIRTTKNTDGSYNGNVGHSMIVLTYDKSSITYIDCNQDGYGKIQVQKRSWSNFNAEEIERKGRRISHIIQCKSALCSHTTDDGKSAYTNKDGQCGICSKCGYVFDWESTYCADSVGTYVLTKDYTPRTDMPYDAGKTDGLRLPAGQKVEVSGVYKNAYGAIWYAFVYGGKTYYAAESYVDFVDAKLQVSCTDFSPKNNQDVEKKSYNLEGKVVSNYPLKSIEAYLDGKKIATWTATDQKTTQLQLKDTVINNSLKFAMLSTGKHTIILKAYAHNGTAAQFHSSVFYSVYALCSHDFEYILTKTPTASASGTLTATCSKCAVSKVITLPKLNKSDYAYKVTKAATCTAAGTARYTWKTTAYGTYYFEVSVAAKGHSYTDNVTEPTCTTRGYTTHTCACGYSYKDAYVAALGHRYSYKVTKVPTVSSSGTLTGTCSQCSASKSVFLPILNKTNYTYRVMKAATCTTSGTARYTLKVTMYGNYYFEASIATKDHSYSEEVTPPTCIEQGYTTYRCACGISYKDHYTSKVAHEYAYGRCMQCSKVDPNCKSGNGDLNTDDVLTDADAIYLLYATFDTKNYPLSEKADYNKDGQVTDADAIYLLYATFDPAGYPLNG